MRYQYAISTCAINVRYQCESWHISKWVTSHVNESCHVWISHIIHERTSHEQVTFHMHRVMSHMIQLCHLWVTTHLNESWHKSKWVTSFMNESCHECVTWHMKESRHIWWGMSHTHVATHCNTDTWHMKESRHISCPTWISHVTREQALWMWAMSPKKIFKWNGTTCETLCCPYMDAL